MPEPGAVAEKAEDAVALPAPEPRSKASLRGHPRGLWTLFFTEMWERFSYYGMRALLILFMTAPAAAGGFAWDARRAGAIYGLYTFSVYFTAIPGGWIADRLLGQRRAVLAGGVLIALGHYALFFMGAGGTAFFYAGLVLIVLGTGLLKPNISAIVGQLYGEGDQRRDAGFSIFYMGINIGAWSAPLICGWLGQRVGWHWGFGAAAFGMTLGIVQYVLGGRHLGEAGHLREKPAEPGRLWVVVLGMLLLTAAALYFLFDYKLLLVGTVTAGFFVWLLRQTRDALEKKRVLAILVLFVFASLFWGGFEQAGSSLNLFADRVTRNAIFGWEFPSSWFQSVNAMFIWMLAPVFAWIWMALGPREPSSPAKFAYALLFVSLGFLVVAVAARTSAPVAAGLPVTAETRLGAADLVSPAWLIVVYLLHTVGELCLSPVGLSAVTKLAPARLVGSMMGVWFLSIALGNLIGGEVSRYFETFALPNLFGAVFLTTVSAAVILALLVGPIRRLMSGVH
ncbi:MAG TPA: peptide MFS transporter [Vicinamibacteria bacterium]|jgi:POT family proton-dependent oligopeptide transporter